MSDNILYKIAQMLMDNYCLSLPIPLPRVDPTTACVQCAGPWPNPHPHPAVFAAPVAHTEPGCHCTVPTMDANSSRLCQIGFSHPVPAPPLSDRRPTVFREEKVYICNH